MSDPVQTVFAIALLPASQLAMFAIAGIVLRLMTINPQSAAEKARAKVLSVELLSVVGFSIATGATAIRAPLWVLLDGRSPAVLLLVLFFPAVLLLWSFGAGLTERIWLGRLDRETALDTHLASVNRREQPHRYAILRTISIPRRWVVTR